MNIEDSLIEIGDALEDAGMLAQVDADLTSEFWKKKSKKKKKKEKKKKEEKRKQVQEDLDSLE